MSINRRNFLKWASSVPIITAPSIVNAALSPAPAEQEHRALKLRNLHTGERANITYWEHGEYLIDGLADIYLLMRDHRQNEVASLDLDLIDQLHHIHGKLETNREIMLVSGYRSPKTNQQLRHSHYGIAEESMHMQGKALDFYIPGINHRHVHKATLAVSTGGVAYYRNSGFIHMDTGRKRRW